VRLAAAFHETRLCRRIWLNSAHAELSPTSQKTQKVTAKLRTELAFKIHGDFVGVLFFAAAVEAVFV